MAAMSAAEHSIDLARAAAAAAADRQATDIEIIDVSDQLIISDCFVLAAAPSDRQVRAVVDAVERRLRGLDAKPVRREVEREGRWVLLDYVDVIVHIQRSDERDYYALDRLWKDCPTVPLDGGEPEPSVGAADAR
jgi:ribosome-associated protein